METEALAHRILVVDDDRSLRGGIGVLLREEGFQATCVADGEEALVALRSEPRPCLILLDLRMPFVDGMSFRRRQLEDPETAGVPVVVVSARRREEEEAERLGISEFIGKPIAFAELLRVVARHCARPHRHEA